MDLKPRYKREKSFAVISMADIVLNLLIFFLLTSSYVIQPGVRVRLPRSATKEAVSEERITISITKEGSIFIDDKPASLSDIPLFLKGAENKIILINSDRDVSISMVIKVIDIVRSLGFKDFVIATTPED
uniref:Biopolymer transporter ExbD n=1 Tax=candidate division WOR-3 bacterium TaxID=2052148 RepID=A0A7C4Y4V2_UNCW3